jgi:hypothetical protein
VTTWTEHDREESGYIELLFDLPVDQETEVDKVNDELIRVYKCRPDQIDWRDDQTCWIYN